MKKRKETCGMLISFWSEDKWYQFLIDLKEVSLPEILTCIEHQFKRRKGKRAKKDRWRI